MSRNIYSELKFLQDIPQPFSCYTRQKLWNDPHLSKALLQAHLDPSNDAASRNQTFMNSSFAWIIDHFKLGVGSSVIDYGCGPGHYTTAFAQAGATVTGIDFSARSINYATEQAAQQQLAINYVQQNYLDFQTEEQFDLITMIWCDFSCLNSEQRRNLLSKFALQLKPGGKVLLDVDSLVRFEKEAEQPVSYSYEADGGFFAPDAYHLFISQHKYPKENVILRRESVFSATDAYELYHWAQCFSQAQLIEEFAQAGLRITDFYSDVAGAPLNDDSWVITLVAEKL